MNAPRLFLRKALVGWLAYAMTFGPSTPVMAQVADNYLTSKDYSDVPLPAKKRPNPNLIFAIDAPRVSAEAVRAAADIAADDEGKLFANDQRAVFTAVVGAKRATTPGSELELAVDVTRLHFFDPGTGHVVDAPRRAAAPA